MTEVPFVSYVTFDSAERTALAEVLAARRGAVAAHVARCGGRLLAEVREFRLDGFDPALTELRRALELCERHGAVLLMARLGGFAGDHAFLARLRDDLARHGLRFAAADMPEVNEGTLGIMAALAAVAEAPAECADRLARKRAFLARLVDRQRRQRAECGRAPALPEDAAHRTADGAAVLHRRACMPRTLERALSVAPVLAEIRAAGATTFEQVAHALNELGVPSARGDRWYPSQVRRVEQRIAAAA